MTGSNEFAEPAARGRHLLGEVQPQHLPVPAGVLVGHVRAPLRCARQLHAAQVPAHGRRAGLRLLRSNACLEWGLDHQLKMHDLNTDQENLVGTHDAPIRCVEYCPEVNVMVTGSWDQTVKLWDPRTPCNAGTFSQPEKVYTLSVSGDRLIVGTAGRRVLVWDLRNMGYVQQRRSPA